MEARIMNQGELRAINDAMPPEAKYGDVFKAIAEKQDAISFKAGQDSRLKEVKEWIERWQAVWSDARFPNTPGFRHIREDELQAFLKGLEGDKK